MANGTCSVEGCDEPTGIAGSARGMCKNHYMKWWWKNRRPVSSGHRGVKRAKGVRLGDVTPKPCGQCGVIMEKAPRETYTRWVARKYCSAQCSNSSRRGVRKEASSRVTLACATCGTAFEVEPYRMAGPYPARYCSWKCAGAARDKGYHSMDKRVRLSAAYKKWRTSVFTRDDYTCQFCGQHGGELNADHIKPFAFFPELRLDVGNGRTLCVACHRKTGTWGINARKYRPA